MLTIYPDSELYAEIQRGSWQEEGELEKYKEVWQLRKLKAMGINGLSIGVESGDDETLALAKNSAELFSQLNPYFVSVDSLTLFPDTKLYKMAQQGLFVPAGEKERIRELQILINNLNIRKHLFANTVSNFTPVTAYLPYDREKVTNELQFVLDNTNETDMKEYRRNLKSLG